MTPTITTDSMRFITGDENFDYVLLCNKVCGAAHFNMEMKIVIETQEQYDAWLKEQKEYLVKEEVEEAPATEQAVEVEESSEQITAQL
jgi:cytochrome c oxidase subunit 2